MAHYNLIFQGKIIDGASLDEVKDNVARLFKADAAKTAALFSGKTIIIKKNLDTESTKKYLAILKKAGAVIRAVKIEDKSTSTLPLTPPVQNNNAADTNDAPTQTPSSGLSAGLASLINYNKPKESSSEDDSSETEGLQLAPVGANILNPSRSNETVEIPDTSHLTMAEAETGSLEEFAQTIEAVELPDIENLTMSEANTGSMEEFTIKIESVELPDISDLDMAEQDNTPLSAGASIPLPVDLPDTSELSISEAQEGTLEGIEIKPEPVEIPDTSHIEIEKTAEEKRISGKATFQLD